MDKAKAKGLQPAGDSFIYSPMGDKSRFLATLHTKSAFINGV